MDDYLDRILEEIIYGGGYPAPEHGEAMALIQSAFNYESIVYEDGYQLILNFD